MAQAFRLLQHVFWGDSLEHMGTRLCQQHAGHPGCILHSAIGVFCLGIVVQTQPNVLSPEVRQSCQ